MICMGSVVDITLKLHHLFPGKPRYFHWQWRIQTTHPLPTTCLTLSLVSTYIMYTSVLSGPIYQWTVLWEKQLYTNCFTRLGETTIDKLFHSFGRNNYTHTVLLLWEKQLYTNCFTPLGETTIHKLFHSFWEKQLYTNCFTSLGETTIHKLFHFLGRNNYTQTVSVNDGCVCSISFTCWRSDSLETNDYFENNDSALVTCFSLVI